MHSSYIHFLTALTFALECALSGDFNGMHFLLPPKWLKTTYDEPNQFEALL